MTRINSTVAWIEAHARYARRILLPELAVAAAASLLYFYSAIRFLEPTGYAGLFSLMAEQVSTENMAHPRSTPFYGPPDAGGGTLGE